MNQELIDVKDTIFTLEKQLKLTDSALQQCTQELSLLDRAINDITHEIELENLNAIELSKKASEFRAFLRKRRECKDNIEMLKVLKDNHDFASFAKLRNRIMIKSKNLETRIYTQKVSQEEREKLLNNSTESRLLTRAKIDIQ